MRFLVPRLAENLILVLSQIETMIQRFARWIQDFLNPSVLLSCGPQLWSLSRWLPLKSPLWWLMKGWRRGERASSLSPVFLCQGHLYFASSALPGTGGITPPACDALQVVCAVRLHFQGVQQFPLPPPSVYARVRARTHTHTHLQWVFTHRPLRQVLCFSERTLEPYRSLLSQFTLLDPVWVWSCLCPSCPAAPFC